MDDRSTYLNAVCAEKMLFNVRLMSAIDAEARLLADGAEEFGHACGWSLAVGSGFIL